VRNRYTVHLFTSAGDLSYRLDCVKSFKRLNNAEAWAEKVLDRRPVERTQYDLGEVNRLATVYDTKTGKALRQLSPVAIYVDSVGQKGTTP
jgi:hypothetical protein